MIDNISKFLIEQYSTDFAAWLLGEAIALTTINPTELNVEPIRADSVMLLQSRDVILHTEFQTVGDETMPFSSSPEAPRSIASMSDGMDRRAVTIISPMKFCKSKTGEEMYEVFRQSML